MSELAKVIWFEEGLFACETEGVHSRDPEHSETDLCLPDWQFIGMRGCGNIVFAASDNGVVASAVKVVFDGC